MHDTTVRLLSKAHAVLYRASGGWVGRRLVNNDMLLLTTTGRTTGTTHTVPLLYLTDGDDFIVIASYGGRPNHPDWYRNLSVLPSGTIQVNGNHHAVEASTLSVAERSAWWPAIVAAYGDYETYQSRTDRVIPVVRLTRVA
jgi:deazaflavin-dependent oxidoreductase (nitroreductase family)